MKIQKIKDKLWVHWQGRLYSLPLQNSAAKRGGADQSAELVAPFSCKVLKVHVKPGQAVKKGDPILVVEAMKMEYSYSSPKDGLIDAVLVKEGEIVSGGSQFVRWGNS